MFGLALVEGIVVVRGEAEPIFYSCRFLVALSRLQSSVATYIRTDLLLLISSTLIKGHCFNQIHSASGDSIQLVIEPPLAFI